MNCNCPDCDLMDILDRRGLRMFYLAAFLAGCLGAVVWWVLK